MRVVDRWVRCTLWLAVVVAALAGWGIARPVQASEEGRVLRHAVFFKFKDSATQADVQKVVDAFAALPEKIDSIIDFEWGKTANAGERSGGFTHCFLLTFQDEAGRAAYLPHEDHKAFGALLGPYLDDVFVIDYWGQADQDLPAKTLRHTVFFKFKDDAEAEQVDKALQTFAQLGDKIDSIEALEWGKNNSPESHDDGFTHAFLVTFASQEGLDQYGPHPAHQALVKLLPPVMEKVRVIDFWTEQD